MPHPEFIPYTRAVGTVRLASKFLDAAKVQPLDRLQAPIVTYYLLGHGLELAFKSILIAHGTSERNLREIGHNLAVARDAIPPDAMNCTLRMRTSLRCSDPSTR